MDKRTVLRRISSDTSFPQVEPLEARLLMSGDVSVGVSRGTLVIRGDSASNHIVIDQAGLAEGQFRITGQDGTKINGQDDLIVSSVTRDVKVRLGDGMDVLEMAGVAISRDLIVRGGHSGETFNITGGSVGRNVTVKAGEGDNTTTVDGTALGGRLTVTGGRGVDLLNLAGDVIVTRQLTFKPGHGETSCTISEATVGGDFVLASRGGPASVSLLFSQFQDRVNINTGKEADNILIEYSEFQDDFIALTGDGNDIVMLEQTTLAPLGEEFVPKPIGTHFAQSATIRLGKGNDVLAIGYDNVGVAFTQYIKLSGGSGEDTLRFDVAIGGVSSSYSAFEHVDTVTS